MQTNGNDLLANGRLPFQKTLLIQEKSMSKKHKGGPAPIPKGNQSLTGPQKPGKKPIAPPPAGAPASEQDPKRRLGNYATAGEHSIEQPDGKQGPNH